LPERFPLTSGAKSGPERKALVDQLERLRQRVAPLKARLLDHPVYREIDRLASLHVFMEHHVFAVWDFMSLLKTLQRLLTCVEIPWLPRGSALGCRLVNEVVLAEESDEDGEGGFVSHFELYRRAMTRCGASTASIDGFLSALRENRSVAAALETAHVGEAPRSFVEATFRVIEERNLYALVSAFSIGREDLLPSLFQRIVDRLAESSGGLDIFRYYLKRHIGLDEEQHGPMASRLLRSACGNDQSRWRIAEEAAVSSLEARQKLWDGIYAIVRRED
jgi:hypothetical protein